MLDFYFGSSLFAAGKRDGDFCAAWTDSFDLSVGINGGNFFVRRAEDFTLSPLASPVTLNAVVV